MSGINSFTKFTLGFIVFALITAATGWITLLIITSGGGIVIPDIAGMNLKSAIGTLQSHHLYLVLDGEEFHPEAPRGAIIAQNPESGTTRKEFSSVRVVLSAGPDRLEMPDYRGFGIRQARHEIQNLNIGAFRESYDFHMDYAEGEVIAHVPGPDEVIVPGSDVTFLISKGVRQQRYRMPDLIGLTIEETRGILQKFGPQIDIKVSERREFGPGVVIEQSPKSGYAISLGDRVTLLVTAEDKLRADAPSLFTWQVPTGFLPKSLIMTYSVNEDTEILLEREVEPSEEIVVNVPNTGKGVLEVILDGDIVFSEVR